MEFYRASNLKTMQESTNVFSNGEIRVTYDPRLCAHSGICCKGLSDVFRNSVIPWIKLDAAETEAIVKQIEQCPSGALKYERIDALTLAK